MAAPSLVFQKPETLTVVFEPSTWLTSAAFSEASMTVPPAL